MLSADTHPSFADSRWNGSLAQRYDPLPEDEIMTPATSEKAYRGMGMEGPTARWYASVTLKSLDEFKSLARRISEIIPRGSAVLEVAPGPGYFAIELAKLDAYSITGLDI